MKETKRCSRCYQEKPLTGFNKRSSSSDGLAYSCRACARGAFKKHYRKNSKNILQKTQERRKSIREKLLEYKKQLFCVLCKENELVCLDLHHVDPANKEFSIAELHVRGFSWTRVQQELDKCVCLCSNCHRKVHAGVVTLPEQQ